MRRFGSVLAVLALVAILVVVEIIIIKGASKYEPQLGVVFAKTRISEGTEINAGMLEVRKVDLSMVHRMALRRIDDASGKMAGADIEAGEMVLSGKLTAGEMEVIRVNDVNKKLFSVEFKSDQANGWWLMTDQTVDIIFVPDDDKPAPSSEVPQDGKNTEGIAAAVGTVDVREGIKVLEDIRVAAIIDEGGKLLKNSGRETLPKYISFEVTDEQAGFLAFAKSHGRLELSVASKK